MKSSEPLSLRGTGRPLLIMKLKTLNLKKIIAKHTKQTEKMQTPPNHAQCPYCSNWYAKKGLQGHIRHCACAPKDDGSDEWSFIPSYHTVARTVLGFICSPFQLCWALVVLIALCSVALSSAQQIGQSVFTTLAGQGGGMVREGFTWLSMMRKDADREADQRI